MRDSMDITVTSSSFSYGNRAEITFLECRNEIDEKIGEEKTYRFEDRTHVSMPGITQIARGFLFLELTPNIYHQGYVLKKIIGFDLCHQSNQLLGQFCVQLNAASINNIVILAAKDAFRADDSLIDFLATKGAADIGIRIKDIGYSTEDRVSKALLARLGYVLIYKVTAGGVARLLAEKIGYTATVNYTPRWERMVQESKRLQVDRDAIGRTGAALRTELDTRTQERDQATQNIVALTVRIQERDRENAILKLGISFMALLGIAFYMRNEDYKTQGVAMVVGAPVLAYSAYSIQSSFGRHRPIERLQDVFPRTLSSGFALALAFCGFAIINNSAENFGIRITGYLMIAGSIYILSNASLRSIAQFGNHTREIIREVTGGLGRGLERFGFLAGRVEVAPNLQHVIAPHGVEVAPHLQHGIAPRGIEVAPNLQYGVAPRAAEATGIRCIML